MNRYLHQLIIIFVLSSVVVQALPLRCGGEGPKPFNDISPKFDHHVQILKTAGEVKEFVFWERHNAVVFRNIANELRALPLTNNSTGTYQPILSLLGQPLANIVEPSEQFLLTQGTGWVFDEKAQPYPWIHFSKETNLQHQFWHRNKIFSVREITNSKDFAYELVSYKVGDKKIEGNCIIGGGAQGRMSLAKGSAFPYVTFYSSRPGAKGTDIFFHELDVRNCKVKEQILQNVMGPIRDVHVFSEQSAYAIQVDHPTENLLWFTPDGCHYHDVGHGELLVPNYHKPILATMSANRSFELFFLNSEMKATILKNYPISHLGPNDIHLSDKNGKLFLAPRFGDEPYKWLLKVDVNANDVAMSGR